MTVALDEKRLEALRAELTEELIRVSADVLTRFGVSGHYAVEFVLKRVHDEDTATNG